MRLKMMVAGLAMGMCVAAVAQHADEGTTSPAKALDVMLTQYEKDAVPTAKAMPADKYDFAPSGTTFADKSPATFEKVRTFGAQVAHVAQANYYFFMLVSGLKPDVDIRALDKMTKKDDAVKALEGSIAFGHKAIATITSANAFQTIKGADGMNTRTTLAAFAVAHGYDHYGQMVEYLRMNGIVPPSSAK
ncbi:MAG: DinB family protein [Acidobacteriota bacterium]|nr:DinB family protein [Acidobacteriota bacterium]